MLRTTTILIVILGAVLAVEAKPQREEFRLRATVLDVVIMEPPIIDGLPRGYLLVDFDAMFAVSMQVVSISPALANFKRGRTVIFAIHSPTFIFPDDNPKGKTYDFTLRRPQPGEKIPTWSLERRR